MIRMTLWSYTTLTDPAHGIRLLPTDCGIHRAIAPPREEQARSIIGPLVVGRREVSG
jgi:hypothetical protein